MTENVSSQLVQQFPSLISLAQPLQDSTELHIAVYSAHMSWSGVPSGLRECVDSALKLVCAAPTFSKVADKAMPYRHEPDANKATHAIVRSSPAWSIPSNEHLDEIQSALGLNPSPSPASRLKWFFSAAATSIDFLESLPSSTRAQIRKIRLNEDFKGVAAPACHSQGLIPFCQENPHLRIERRVDLWRAVHIEGANILQIRRCPLPPLERIPTDYFINFIGEWIDEAHALVPAGMPEGSHMLSFDASPDDLQTTFNLLKKVALWHEAKEESRKRGGIIDQPYDPKRPLEIQSRGRYYVSDTFIQAMKDATQRPNSFVRFDCIVDPSWNLEPLIERSRGWYSHDWQDMFKEEFPRFLIPDPSMPRLSDIQREYVYDPDQQEE